jgi:hypothetical protein
MQKPSSVSRRELFLSLGRVAPAVPFLGVAMQGLAQSAAKPAASPAPAAAATCNLAPANDPVATGLKYVTDAAKAADRPAKMGVEGKAQNCANCQLYTKVTEDAGKCVMIASGCVTAKGWCTGWVKKA